jgi:hypothetical protein
VFFLSSSVLHRDLKWDYLQFPELANAEVPNSIAQIETPSLDATCLFISWPEQNYGTHRFCLGF